MPCNLLCPICGAHGVMSAVFSRVSADVAEVRRRRRRHNGWLAMSF